MDGDLVPGRLGVKPVEIGVPLADLGPSQHAGNPGQQQAAEKEPGALGTPDHGVSS